MSCLQILKRYSAFPLEIELSGYQFSVDGTTWVNDKITLGQYDYSAYVKGNHYPSGARFIVSNDFRVDGSLSSLIDDGQGGFINEITEPGAFSGLFSGSPILDFNFDELLPFSILKENCFAEMFANCPKLSIGTTTSPGTLFNSVQTSANECCLGMFAGCNFTEIPETLFANFPLSEGCFNRMFSNNPSLEGISEILLPSTDVPKEAYYEMFAGCSGLYALPEKLLPAEHVDYKGYSGMFKNCTNLKAIPKDFLPTTRYENYAYSNMFEGCSSLTSVSKDLFKQNEDWAHYMAGVYSEMFKNCSSLSRIEFPFNYWPDDKSSIERYALRNWVSGVAAHGVFICPEELPKIYDASHIPVGWKMNPGNAPFSVSFLNKVKIGGRAK